MYLAVGRWRVTSPFTTLTAVAYVNKVHFVLCPAWVVSNEWPVNLFKMWLQLWKKLFKRKPIAAVILGIVLFSAIITIFRLSNSSPSRDDHYVSSRSSSGRSTSPVELSWPLPLTSERLKRADMKSKKIFVDVEQMIKLKKIYPL